MSHIQYWFLAQAKKSSATSPYEYTSKPILGRLDDIAIGFTLEQKTTNHCDNYWRPRCEILLEADFKLSVE